MFLTGIAFVLCLVPLTVNSQCSISLFTRKRCSTTTVISGSEACLAAGCCYDENPLIPVSGRCYKKGGSLQMGGFRFSPTAPPSPRGGAGGILNVGGEPGFPGSELLLKCNPLLACPASGFYPKDIKSDCIRQGCCWRGGRCFKNTVLILRLRSKCPPGHKDPPACHVINKCDDSPCLNSGKCAFVSPGEFSCDCPGGFSGKICHPNCQPLTITKGSMVPAFTNYPMETPVILKCQNGATPQDGAVSIRTCKPGGFEPTLLNAPFTCSSDCPVTVVPGTKVVSTTQTTVRHNTPVTYECLAGSIPATTNKMTRTCTDGKLLPLLDNDKIVCLADCEIGTVQNADASKTGAITHGIEVKYTCKPGFTAPVGTKFIRKCQNGKLDPPLTDDEIICSADCEFKKPGFSTAIPDQTSIHHGQSVTFSCIPTHAGSSPASTTRKCDNGKLSKTLEEEPYVCSENCKITQISNAKPAPPVVIHGNSVTFACLDTHAPLAGQVAKRECENGDLKPLLTDSEFECFKKCTIPKVTDATSDPSAGSIVLHKTPITFTCADKHHAKGVKLERTCENGDIKPPVADIICKEKCLVTALENGGATPAVGTLVDHKAPVKYHCNIATHSAEKGTNFDRTCEDGTLEPTDKITCYANCGAAPKFENADVDAGTSFVQGSVVTYKCKPGHTKGENDVMTKTCVKGSWSSASKITCSPDCTNIPAVVGATMITKQPIHNLAKLQYQCNADHIQADNMQMERTCVAGNVSPDPKDIKCYAPCTFKMPDHTKVGTEGGTKLVHNAKLVFGCEKGFTPTGKSVATRKCDDGKLDPNLEDNPFTCLKDCDPPKKVPGTSYVPSKDNIYHDGAVVTYKCDGDTTTPDQLTRTCTDGHFKPTFEDKELKCYPGCTPETLTGGSYLPTLLTKHDHGTKVEYKCPTGTTLSDEKNKERTCKNGHFSPTFKDAPLACNLDCKIEKIFDNTDKDRKEATMHHGDEVKYTCASGFSNSDTPFSIRKCDNGKLDPPKDQKFICYADCPKPTPIDNGAFEPDAVVKHKDTIKFVCNKDLFSSLKTDKIVRTCLNGRYDPDFKKEPLECYKNCVPEKLTNGIHKPTQDKYHHQDVVEYECNNKHSPVSSKDLKRTCIKGFFSPTLLEKKIECLPDCDVPKKEHATTDPTGTSVVATTKVTYNCEKGRSVGVAGTAERTCKEGKLQPVIDASNDIVCNPNCPVPTIGTTVTVKPPPQLADGYMWGTRLTFTCAPKHHVKRGVQTVIKQCNDKGEITPKTDVVCLKECESPPTLTNGKFKASTNERPMLDEDFLEYECNPTFSHPADAKTKLTCKNGNYEPTFKDSKLVCNEDCKAPDVANSVIEGQADRYKHGAEITIKCKPLHTLIGTPNLKRTCVNSNWDKSFTQEKVSCHHQCEFKGIENGKGNVDGKEVAKNSWYDHDKTLVASCNPGYTHLSTAKTKRVCSDKTITPSFEKDEFKCYRDCTVKFPTDGKTKSGRKVFHHGEIITFMCNSDILFTLAGDSQAKCEDGELKPVQPPVPPKTFKLATCEANCQMPAGLKNVKYDPNLPALSYAKHLQNVKFKCLDGHSMLVADVRQCLKGKWADPIEGIHLIVCYKDCPVDSIDKLPNINAPTTKTIKHDEKHTYTCQTGYTMDKDSTIVRTCDEGHLKPLMTVKKPICHKNCDPSAYTTVKNAFTKPATGIAHYETVTYECTSEYHHLKTHQMTRSCDNGKLKPTLKDKPIACHKKCKVTTVNNATPDTTNKMINTGESVSYTCHTTHSPNVDANLVRTCQDGELYPKFTSNQIDCKLKCTVKELPHATSSIKKGEVIHNGALVTYTCEKDFTVEGGSNKFIARCDNGDFQDVKTCKKQCLVTAIPNTESFENDNKGRHVDFGTKVEYKCKAGYSTKDAVLATQCGVDGKFVINLTCHPDCSGIDIPADTKLELSDPKRVKYGDEVTYTCTEDYSRFSTGVNIMKVKCENGKVETKAVVCSGGCTVPDIAHLKSPTKGTKVAHGASIKYECNTLFAPKHDTKTEVKCNAGTLPSIVCLPQCRVPSLIQGTADPGATNYIAEGASVTYSCNKGYSTPDNKVIPCKNGRIDNSALKCYKDCDLIPAISNADSNPVKAPVLHTKSVVYTCKINYMTTNTNDMTTKCVDGTIDASKVICYSKCQIPTNSAYAKDTVPAPGTWLDHKPGHEVEITCASGHYASATTKTKRQCNNGVWNIPFSATDPIICNEACKVPTFLNATPKNKKVGDILKENEEVEYTCNNGWSSPDQNKIKCNDGKLTPATFKCYQVCQATNNVINNAKTASSFPVDHGVKVTYTCDPDYNTETADFSRVIEMTCSNGVLDTKGQNCYEKCKLTDSVPNAEPVKDTYKNHGQEFEYKCLTGYLQKEAAVKRKCMKGKIDKTISQFPVTCQKSCTLPKKPNMKHDSKVEEIKHRDQVTYTCKEGFDGSNPVTVLCNEGKLLGPLDTANCKPQCKVPDDVHNTDPESGRYFTSDTGKQILIKCKSPYEHQDDAKLTRFCKNGKWDPTFEDSKLICKRKCEVPKVNEAKADQTMGTFIKATQQVKYTCNPGFTMTGTATRTCMDLEFNPKFKDDEISCNAECTKIPTVLHTTKDSSATKINHGQGIKYTCGSDYNTANGGDSFTITCDKGRMDVGNNQCYSKCTVPATLKNTLPSAGTKLPHKPGFKVKFQCTDKNFPQKDEQMERICDSGVWSPAFDAKTPITCRKKCPVPKIANGEPTGGVTVGSNIMHNAEVTYKCEAGYSTHAKLVRKCNDGAIDINDLLCKKECVIPNNIPHVSPPKGSILKHHETEKYDVKCAPGKIHQTGAELKRSCKNGVIEPSFSTKPLLCSDGCPAIHVDNAEYGFKANDPVPDKHKVTYKCSKGYTIEGKAERTCTKGAMSPDMTKEKITCHKDCATVPQITDATPSKTANVPGGTSVTYTCKANFNAKDQTQTITIKCLEGKIDTTGHKCFSQCQVPATVLNTIPASLSYSKHDPNTPVEFKCTAGKVPKDGEKTKRTCNSGNWDPPFNAANPLTCRSECTVKAATNAELPSTIKVDTKVKHDTVISYTCVKEHSSIASTNIKCVDGTLDTSTFSCEKQCKIPDDVLNTNPTAGSYLNHHPTTQYEIKCADGYFPETTPPKRTCEKGTLKPDFKSKPLICKRECTVPPVTGSTIVTPGIQVGQKIRAGTPIEYKCDGDLTNENSLKRTCEDKKFSPDFDEKPLSCNKGCTSMPTIEHATNTNTNIQTRKHGETLTFKCNTGRSGPNGSPNVVIMCQKGVMVVRTEDICGLNCKTPEVPNSKISKDTVVNHDTSQTYVCNDNYAAKDGENLVRKCVNGDLFPKIDQTNPITCEQMCRVDGFNFATASPVASGQYLAKGKTTTYTCEATHNTNGLNARTCGDGGKLTPDFKSQPFKCSKKCQTITKVAGSTHEPKTGPVDHGSKVKYTCNDNYHHLSGATMEVSCNEGSLDVSNTICYQKCQVPKEVINTNHAPLSYHLSGAKVTFACTGDTVAQDGAVLERSCTNGNWEKPFKTHPIECRKQCTIENVAHATANPAIGTKIKDGKSTYYSCKPGYTTTHERTRKCKDGVLTPEINSISLVCNKNCETIPKVDGASTKTSSTVSHGTEVKYTCDPGHSPGSTSVMNPKCHKGTIDVSKTKCYLNCKTPEVANSKTTKGTDVPHGTSITFACKDNWDARDGEKMDRKCENGKLDPPIDANSPINCEQMCQIPKRDNSDSTPTALSYIKKTKTVTYKCNDNYHTSDENTRKCGENGKLTPSFDERHYVCHKDCSKAVALTGKTAGIKLNPDKANYKHGESVTLSCDAKTHVHSGGTPLTKCEEGTLKIDFQCKKKCDVKAGTNTQVRSLGLVDPGTVVLYQCNPGYATKLGTTANLKCGDDGELVSNVNGEIATTKCEKMCTVASGTKTKPVTINPPQLRPGARFEYECQDANLFPAKDHTLKHICATTGGQLVADHATKKATSRCSPKCPVNLGTNTNTKMRSITHVMPMEKFVYQCMGSMHQPLIGTNLNYICDPTGTLVGQDDKSTNVCYLRCTAQPGIDVTEKFQYRNMVTPGDTFVYECKNSDYQNKVGETLKHICDYRTGKLIGNEDKKVASGTCYKKCTVDTKQNTKTEAEKIQPGAAYTYKCKDATLFVKKNEDPNHTCEVGSGNLVRNDQKKNAFTGCYKQCKAPKGVNTNTDAETLVLPGEKHVYKCKDANHVAKDNKPLDWVCDTTSGNMISADSKKPSTTECVPKCELHPGANVKDPGMTHIMPGKTIEYECVSASYGIASTQTLKYVCSETDGSLSGNDPPKTPVTGCVPKCIAPAGTNTKQKSSTPVEPGKPFVYECKDANYGVLKRQTLKYRCDEKGNFVGNENGLEATTKCWKKCKAEGGVRTTQAGVTPVDPGHDFEYKCQDGYGVLFGETHKYKCNHETSELEPREKLTATKTCYKQCTASTKTNTNVKTEQKVNPGATFFYKCDDNHVIKDGETLKFKCQTQTAELVPDDGNKPGISQCLPQCQVPQGKGTTHQITTYIDPGADFEYKCKNNDFVVMDGSTLKHKCHESNGKLIANDGNKASATSCAEKCKVPAGTNLKKHTETEVMPGKTILLQCADNYGILKSQTLDHKCKDGKLESNVSGKQGTTTCIPKCTAPAGINTEQKTAQIVEPGEPFEYKCESNEFGVQDGYTLKWICDNGNWVSNEKPKVPTSTCHDRCPVSIGKNTLTSQPTFAEPGAIFEYKCKNDADFQVRKGYSLKHKCQVKLADAVLEQVDPSTPSSTDCYQKCTVSAKTNTNIKEATKAQPGAEVTYKCEENTVVKEGETLTFVCDHVSSTLKAKGGKTGATQCYKKCKVPKGKDTTTTIETYINPGASHEYKCKDAYHVAPPGNSLKWTCENSGELKEVSKPAAKYCLPKCKLKKGINTKDLEAEYIDPEGTYLYKCKDNFAILKTQTLHHKCGTDGNLVSADSKTATIECTPKCTAPAGTNTLVSGVRYINPGTKHEYQCKDSTYGVKKGETLKYECTDKGNWIGNEQGLIPSTECHKKCTAPAGTQTNENKETPVDPGHDFSYTCVANHGPKYGETHDYICNHRTGTLERKDKSLTKSSTCYKQCTAQPKSKTKTTKPVMVNQGAPYVYECEDNHIINAGESFKFKCTEGTAVLTFDDSPKKEATECYKQCEAKVGQHTTQAKVMYIDPGKSHEYYCIDNLHTTLESQTLKWTCDGKSAELKTAVTGKTAVNSCIRKCNLKTSKTTVAPTSLLLDPGKTHQYKCIARHAILKTQTLMWRCNEKGNLVGNELNKQEVHECIPQCEFPPGTDTTQDKTVYKDPGTTYDYECKDNKYSVKKGETLKHKCSDTGKIEGNEGVLTKSSTCYKKCTAKGAANSKTTKDTEVLPGADFEYKCNDKHGPNHGETLSFTCNLQGELETKDKAKKAGTQCYPQCFAKGGANTNHKSDGYVNAGAPFEYKCDTGYVVKQGYSLKYQCNALTGVLSLAEAGKTEAHECFKQCEAAIGTNTVVREKVLVNPGATHTYKCIDLHTNLPDTTLTWKCKSISNEKSQLESAYLGKTATSTCQKRCEIKAGTNTKPPDKTYIDPRSTYEYKCIDGNHVILSSQTLMHQCADSGGTLGQKTGDKLTPTTRCIKKCLAKAGTNTQQDKDEYKNLEAKFEYTCEDDTYQEKYRETLKYFCTAEGNIEVQDKNLKGSTQCYKKCEAAAGTQTKVTKKQSVQPGAEFVYDCNTGYGPKEGESLKYQCDLKGNLNSAEPSKLKSTICHQQCKTDPGKNTKEHVKYVNAGAKFSYQCLDGYAILEGYTLNFFCNPSTHILSGAEALLTTTTTCYKKCEVTVGEHTKTKEKFFINPGQYHTYECKDQNHVNVPGTTLKWQCDKDKNGELVPIGAATGAKKCVPKCQLPKGKNVKALTKTVLEPKGTYDYVCADNYFISKEETLKAKCSITNGELESNEDGKKLTTECSQKCTVEIGPKTLTTEEKTISPGEEHIYRCKESDHMVEFGKTLKWKCDKGTLKANDGQKTGSKECYKKCPVDAGTETATSTTTSVQPGATFDYQCKTNFGPEHPKSLTWKCGLAGALIDASSTVASTKECKKQCDKPAGPGTTTTSTEKVNPGAPFTYTCKDNHVILAGEVLTWTCSATDSQPKPKGNAVSRCLPQCQVPVIATTTHKKATYIDPGQTFDYVCEGDLAPRGGQTLKHRCDSKTGVLNANDGSKVKLTSCVTKCTLPKGVNTNEPGENKILPGAKAVFTCKKDFAIKKTQTLEFVCGNDGQLQTKVDNKESTSECQEACPLPKGSNVKSFTAKSLAPGETHDYECVDNNHQVEEGFTLKVKCDGGLKGNDGVLKPSQICYKKCNVPIGTDTTLSQATTAQPGATYLYECKDGYGPEHPKTLQWKCTTDNSGVLKKFSDAAESTDVCFKQCDALSFGANVNAKANKVNRGATETYTCKSDYFVKVTQSLVFTCKKSGDGSALVPSDDKLTQATNCFAKCPVPVGQNTQTTKSGSTILPGEKHIYKCTDNKYAAPHNTILEHICGESGSLESAVKGKTAVKECGLKCNTPEGTNTKPHSKTTIVPDEILNYQCSSNEYDIPGTHTLTHKCDGATGQLKTGVKGKTETKACIKKCKAEKGQNTDQTEAVKLITPGEKHVYRCKNDGFMNKKGTSLNWQCTNDGQFLVDSTDKLITGTKDCLPKCTVNAGTNTKPIADQSKNSNKIQAGADYDYVCTNDNYGILATQTLKWICGDTGSLVPQTADKNKASVSACIQKCPLSEGTNTKKLPKTLLDPGTSHTYECESNQHVNLKGTTLMHSCPATGGTAVSGEKDMTLTRVCHKYDSNIEMLFMPTHHNKVDDCETLRTKAKTQGSLTEAQILTHISGGKSNFLQQIKVIKEIYNKWVLPGQTHTRFAVYSNEKDICTNYDRNLAQCTGNLKKQLTETTTMEQVFAGVQYQCEGKKEVSVQTLQFAWDLAFKSKVRSNSKPFAVVFTNEEPMSQNVLKLVYKKASDLDPNVKELYTFILLTQPRTDSKYPTLSTKWTNVMNTGIVSDAKVWKGQLLGSQWDNIDTLMQTIRAKTNQ